MERFVLHLYVFIGVLGILLAFLCVRLRYICAAELSGAAVKLLRLLSLTDGSEVVAEVQSCAGPNRVLRQAGYVLREQLRARLIEGPVNHVFLKAVLHCVRIIVRLKDNQVVAQWVLRLRAVKNKIAAHLGAH